MAFLLDCALIRPYDIIKLIISPLQALLFIDITNQMTAYAQPQKVHSSDVRHRRIVRRWMLYPWLFRRLYSWIAVVLSSRCICSSTNAFTSSVILVCLPEPLFRLTSPVISYLLRKSCTPFCVQCRFSSRSSLAIVGALFPAAETSR